MLWKPVLISYFQGSFISEEDKVALENQLKANEAEMEKMKQTYEQRLAQAAQNRLVSF